MSTAAGALPRHVYCFVERSFLRRDGEGFEPCVWFGLTSTPGRAWGCTVMLRCGAVYRSLPPHALAFREAPEAFWGIASAQLWNCYGRDFEAISYPFLDGLRVRARVGGREILGDYLFTVAPFGDGYSDEPGQQKEFTFVRLDNGRLTILPTDRTLFVDRSFTDDAAAWPRDLIRQEKTWSCEK